MRASPWGQHLWRAGTSWQSCTESTFGSLRPKNVKWLLSQREIEIFEMTDDQHKYKGYTVIEGFKGNNIEELKENIDNYLKDLMAKINEPVVDCPHCKGKGIVLNKG